MTARTATVMAAVIQRPIDDWLEMEKDAANEFPEHIHMSTSGKNIRVRADDWGVIIIIDCFSLQERILPVTSRDGAKVLTRDQRRCHSWTFTSFGFLL